MSFRNTANTEIFESEIEYISCKKKFNELISFIPKVILKNIF